MRWGSWSRAPGVVLGVLTALNGLNYLDRYVGPLNAAMANVLPAELRARGFALTTMLIHLLGDAASPWLIGEVSDRIGLEIPVLVTGCLLTVAGAVLLCGQRTLVVDLRR